MLKLNASYSKKIPVPGEDYSSQSFHCSMEVELSDTASTEQLQSKIHETFAMVRGAVETELHGKQPEKSDLRVLPNKDSSQKAETTAKASNKQIRYILDLAKDRGLGISQINEWARQQFGADSVYDIDRKAASRMVDELKAAA